MPPLEERAAVRRLYDRFGWGARRSDVDDGARRGFDACVDTLFAPTGDDPGAAATPSPSVDMGEPPKDGSDARKAFDEQRSEHQRDMALWWLDRMAAVNAPVRERMTWFWHGHFATSQEKVNRPAMMLRQNETLRDRALGSFADLARAMVADPARTSDRRLRVSTLSVLTANQRSCRRRGRDRRPVVRPLRRCQ